jgi:hypothetical protein
MGKNMMFTVASTNSDKHTYQVFNKTRGRQRSLRYHYIHLALGNLPLGAEVET